MISTVAALVNVHTPTHIQLYKILDLESHSLKVLSVCGLFPEPANVTVREICQGQGKVLRQAYYGRTKYLPTYSFHAYLEPVTSSHYHPYLYW